MGTVMRRPTGIFEQPVQEPFRFFGRHILVMMMPIALGLRAGDDLKQTGTRSWGHGLLANDLLNGSSIITKLPDCRLNFRRCASRKRHHQQYCGYG